MVSLCLKTYRSLCAAALCAVLLTVSGGLCSDEACAQPADTLERVVVLVKDGVRSPTLYEQKLQKVDQGHTWSDWPVGTGQLTSRGADLIRSMWLSVGRELRTTGIFPASGCPSQDDVFIRADSMGLSHDSASALLEGLAPGCRIGYYALQSGLDPLFHVLRSGYCPLKPQEAARSVIRSLPDGSLTALSDSLSGELDVLDNLLAPLNKELCERYRLPNCHVSEMTSNVTVMPRGTGVYISGGLGMAAGFADIFLMEYYQGPDAEASTAAWSKANGSTVISSLWTLRTAARNAVNRSHLVSGASSSALLDAMLSGLVGKNPARGAEKAKLLIFVAHDMNLGQLAGLAGLHWKIPGIVADNPALPGCALTMELWKRPDGSRYVRSHFLSLTHVTLHSKALRTESGELPPVQHMTIDVTDDEDAVVNMSLEQFVAAMYSRIRVECVPQRAVRLKLFYPGQKYDDSAEKLGLMQ